MNNSDSEINADNASYKEDNEIEENSLSLIEIFKHSYTRSCLIIISILWVSTYTGYIAV